MTKAMIWMLGILCGGLALGQGAAPLQVGKQYSAGAWIASAWTGVHFQVPVAFTGRYDATLAGFLMTSHKQPLRVVVFAFSGGKPEGVAGYIASGLEDAGVQLRLRGEPKVSGTQISALADTHLPQGAGVMYLTVKRGQPGNVAAVLALGLSADEVALRRIADGVLASMRFGRPGPGLEQSRQALSGTRLFATGSNSNSGRNASGRADGSRVGSWQDQYDFCGDGRYVYTSTTESIWSVPGLSAENQSSTGHTGTWTLVADLIGQLALVLETTDGRTFVHAVAKSREGKVMLDSQAFSLAPSERCP
jgi:hypothetical protein